MHTVARSIHHDRPRGIFAGGVEEPNALVALEEPFHEPVLTATTVELFDGLCARGLAGRGRLEPPDDGAFYDRMHAHCDVLVVGAGPAGLAAALAAGRSGARVILADEQPEAGGDLLGARETLDGAPAGKWVASAIAELRRLSRGARPDAHDRGGRLRPRLPSRARAAHRAPRRRRTRASLAPAGVAHPRAAGRARDRRARTADRVRRQRPAGDHARRRGRTYVNRYAVAPGERAVVFTTNDAAYAAALALADAGVSVATVIDARTQVPAVWRERCAAREIDVLAGHAVTGTGGEERLDSVRVAPLDTTGALAGPCRTIGCDLLAVSGGWNPVTHLFSQAGGRLRFDPRLGGFVPDGPLAGYAVVGAARGQRSLTACLADGALAGARAATETGFAAAQPVLPAAEEPAPSPPRALWLVPPEDDSWTRHYVDLARDATVADVHRAVGAGMRSVEHIKRYTTIGTGPDQGKTSGVLATGVIAHALDAEVDELGTTTYRPPYTPVSFAALAGRDRGRLHDPIRVSAIHAWHVAHGARFENVGQWKRPWYFPHDGEEIDAGGRARMPRRPRFRRVHGRLDARQDRRPRPRCRRLPGPRLHQPDELVEGRRDPLRGAVPRRTGWCSTTGRRSGWPRTATS